MVHRAVARIPVALFLASTLVLTAPPADAATPAPRPVCPAAQCADAVAKPPPYLNSLNLDKAQRARLEAQLRESGPALRDKASEVLRAENELRRLLLSPGATDAQAKPLAETIGARTSELILLRLQLERKILDILTPEQRQRLAASLLEAPPRPAPNGN